MRKASLLIPILFMAQAFMTVARADEIQIEFATVEGLTDATLAAAKKPVKVGATTHSQYGRIVLWCKGTLKDGRYTCAIKKAGSNGTRLNAIHSASIAAPFIPGGAVVSICQTSTDE